jgi:anti-repressor protein
MKELQIFKHESFGEVRVIEKDGEPWFIAADVLRCLDLKSNTSLADLDEDEADTHTVRTSSQRREMTIISEPGFYKLVLKSRKSEAKAVQRWVTHEVLPAIRKHGAYMTEPTIQKVIDDPDFLIELATRLKEEKQRRIVAEKQVAIAAPAMKAWERIAARGNTLYVVTVAQLISDERKISLGGVKMFRWMRNNGWCHYKTGWNGKRYNAPYQDKIDAGLLRLEMDTINRGNGDEEQPVIKVTAKGLQKLINIFVNMSPLDIKKVL